jgi:hypothetical protein
MGVATPYINDAVGVCVFVCVCVCDNVHTVQATAQHTFRSLWYYSTSYRQLYNKISRIDFWNNRPASWSRGQSF